MHIFDLRVQRVRFVVEALAHIFIPGKTVSGSEKSSPFPSTVLANHRTPIWMTVSLKRGTASLGVRINALCCGTKENISFDEDIPRSLEYLKLLRVKRVLPVSGIRIHLAVYRFAPDLTRHTIVITFAALSASLESVRESFRCHVVLYTRFRPRLPGYRP